MWKLVVAISLAGLITSLAMLFDVNVRYGAPTPDAHAQIEDVLPGSPAARVGLQRGDIVLAVDGIDVPMYELKQRISCGCAATRQRTITVERDGETLSMPILAEHRRIGIHFAQAMRYEPNLFRASRQAYRTWQRQAFAPFEMASAMSAPCPFGEHHLLSIHSAPHRRAAIMSLMLFWGSLLSLFGAFAVALRGRKRVVAL